MERANGLLMGLDRAARGREEVEEKVAEVQKEEEMNVQQYMMSKQ